MALHVLQHRLSVHYMNQLRDKDTPSEIFRVAGERLTTLLAAEATRDLPVEPTEVVTPLETHATVALSMPMAVIGILRAGIGMMAPLEQLLPHPALGFVGMERDEATAQAATYYSKLPSLEGRIAFVVDPMLATGGSAAHTLELVYRERPAEVRFLCLVAAPEGVARLEKAFPALSIFAASLDRELDARKYILPGLGDYGDRLFGTV